MWYVRVDKGSHSSVELGGGRASVPPGRSTNCEQEGEKRAPDVDNLQWKWLGRGKAAGLSQHQRGGTQKALTSHKGNKILAVFSFGNDSGNLRNR